VYFATKAESEEFVWVCGLVHRKAPYEQKESKIVERVHEKSREMEEEHVLGTDSSLKRTECAQQTIRSNSECSFLLFVLLFSAAIRLRGEPFGLTRILALPLSTACSECRASAFLPHDRELSSRPVHFFFQASIRLDLCARRLEISQSILESSSECFSAKSASRWFECELLDLQPTALGDILTLMTRREVTARCSVRWWGRLEERKRIAGGGDGKNVGCTLWRFEFAEFRALKRAS